MIFDDKGGGAVQTTPKIDDIISEQPLSKGMVILLYVLGLSVCPIPWATHRVGNGL